MNNKYIPGVCNIGNSESLKRRNVGIFGIISTVSFSLLFFVFSVDPFFEFIIIFISLFYGILGLFQSREHFCVYYSYMKEYNFSDSDETPVTVTDKNDSNTDIKRAANMIFKSAALSLIYTILYTLITL